MRSIKVTKVSTIHDGHAERIWCACWSPCGTALATCSSDCTIKIWRCKQDMAKIFQRYDCTSDGAVVTPPAEEVALEWECVQTIEGDQKRSIRCVSWSPDGRSLASSSFDRTVAVYKLIGDYFEAHTTLEGYENEVKWVDWSVDCKTLATCSRDKNIWMWVEDEDGDWNCESVLTGHTQDVKQVRFHPSQEFIISASYDNTVRCWIYDGDELYNECTVSNHTSTVWSIATSSDVRTSPLSITVLVVSIFFSSVCTQKKSTR
uniref:Putative cytosolic iron-sulfur protein assembly protein CIAO1-like protein n=1 Tax=Lygus hesperus TaxID=30085 RepID=A0A0A9WK00_LYGHE